MGIRTVEVLPPSARTETSGVLRAAGGIVVVVLLFVTLQAKDGAVRVRSLSSGEPTVAFADLPPADQRIVRALQEGLVEAENQRGLSGEWPSVQQLASEGIPPFAPDPLDRAGYTWAFARQGTVVNYTGVPAAGSDRPSFLALILEPDPGTPIDPGASTDEIHHKLRDGTMLHVSIGRGPRLADLGEPWPALPTQAGWARVSLQRP